MFAEITEITPFVSQAQARFPTGTCFKIPFFRVGVNFSKLLQCSVGGRIAPKLRAKPGKGSTFSRRSTLVVWAPVPKNPNIQNGYPSSSSLNSAGCHLFPYPTLPGRILNSTEEGLGCNSGVSSTGHGIEPMVIFRTPLSHFSSAPQSL